MGKTYRESRASGKAIKERTCQPASKFWKRTTQRRDRHNASRFLHTVLTEAAV